MTRLIRMKIYFARDQPFSCFQTVLLYPTDISPILFRPQIAMSPEHEYDLYKYSNKTVFGINDTASRYAWAGFLVFVLISSFFGDTTILIASIKYRAFKLHKIIIAVIQHIAFCDLMVTFLNALPRFVSVVSNEWVFGNFLGYLVTYTKYYFNGSSMFLVCIMTCSKVLLLKYPLRFAKVSVKKAHMLCGACWLAALITPVSFILVSILDGEDIYFSYRHYLCELTFKSDTWYWLKPLLTVAVVFIPNCRVIATTVYLLIIAKQVARRGRESLKWQGIMTTVSIAAIYCISVLPYAVYNIGESSVDDDSFFHTSFYRVANSFPYFNTISNFYIYSLSVHSFRDFIRSRIQQTYQIFTSIGTSAGQGEIIVILNG